MGRDRTVLRLLIALEVSIHAPAWGATNMQELRSIQQLVSIHAPAWGATQGRGPFVPHTMFQFTRPHGARQIGAIVDFAISRFNSRARMGRDCTGWGVGGSRGGFNSRARMGRDSALRRSWVQRRCFNSRARMGRDAALPPARAWCACFNSRARMGRDRGAADH